MLVSPGQQRSLCLVISRVLGDFCPPSAAPPPLPVIARYFSPILYPRSWLPSHQEISRNKEGRKWALSLDQAVADGRFRPILVLYRLLISRPSICPGQLNRHSQIPIENFVMFRGRRQQATRGQPRDLLLTGTHRLGSMQQANRDERGHVLVCQRVDRPGARRGEPSPARGRAAAAADAI